jgi:hypothetical protein
MLRELASHVWQSTLFAAVVALLTLAFRRNRAQVRYWLWFSASFKFFIPFSLLVSLGRHFAWAPVAHRVATHMTASAFGFAVAPVIQNFPDPFRFVPTESGANRVLVVLAGLWTCGLAGIALIRLSSYRRIRAAVRSPVTPSRCQSNPAPVDRCFTVHGRLRAYNGNPTFRIWRIGTNRLIGVTGAKPGDDPIMPENLACGFLCDVVADFKLCPFSESKPGVMQRTCVEAVNNKFK